MTKRQKRLERLRQNPTNISPDELRVVLEDQGFELVNIVGSHYTYQVEIGGVPHLLVVPYRRPLKVIYIKKALDLIDKRLEEGREEEEPDE